MLGLREEPTSESADVVRSLLSDVTKPGFVARRFIGFVRSCPVCQTGCTDGRVGSGFAICCYRQHRCPMLEHCSPAFRREVQLWCLRHSRRHRPIPDRAYFYRSMGTTFRTIACLGPRTGRCRSTIDIERLRVRWDYFACYERNSFIHRLVRRAECAAPRPIGYAKDTARKLLRQIGGT
jgi:hypothetical protein